MSTVKDTANTDRLERDSHFVCPRLSAGDKRSAASLQRLTSAFVYANGSAAGIDARWVRHKSESERRMRKHGDNGAMDVCFE